VGPALAGEFFPGAGGLMAGRPAREREYHRSWLEVPTPAYVVEENLLRHNLEILAGVQQETGAKILLAQKCFSMQHYYPLLRQYLAGTTASGLYEARLGFEEMGGETHVFSPAYKPEELRALAQICDHISFNSLKQWERYGAEAQAAGVSCGLRINPEYSTQGKAIYDPCAPGSRLGVRRAELEAFPEEGLQGLEGLHFHTLCEQGAEALAETLAAVEKGFGEFLRLPGLKWLNMGGGHHITKPGYDLELLKQCIRRVRQEYGLEVYLEPGEAVALNAGFLVSEVLEVQPEQDGVANVILDTSAACHMPDVLEMPYRPPVLAGGEPGELGFTYRFGGPTCLAGDIIGEYSFAEPLQAGERVIFCDMAIYTMVKTNTFNGLPLPSIIAVDRSGDWAIVKSFGYEEFERRV